MTGTAAPPLAFEKYEGLGNDFLVVDGDASGAPVDAARAAALCDRHRGVGGDGVLVVHGPSASRDRARMRVLNADGSVPEMCGNGLRCVALHLFRTRGMTAFEVDTDAGARSCAIEATTPGPPSRGEARLVTVGMGRVRVLGPRTVVVDGESVEVWCADAGNPHAILRGPLDPERWTRLAPRLATHRDFPEGANVGLVVTSPEGVDLVVWERGVGLTQACGTGACAAVAVATEQGWVVAPGAAVDVRLPGGRLSVTRDPRSAETTMRGPARWVFSGVA